MIYYLTFGQRYRDEEHPYLTTHPYMDTKIHPDGWWEVTAEDESKARELAFSILGQEWSSLYSEEDFDKSYFPLGKIGEIQAL